MCQCAMWTTLILVNWPSRFQSLDLNFIISTSSGQMLSNFKCLLINWHCFCLCGFWFFDLWEFNSTESNILNIEIDSMWMSYLNQYYSHQLDEFLFQIGMYFDVNLVTSGCHTNAEYYCLFLYLFHSIEIKWKRKHSWICVLFKLNEFWMKSTFFSSSEFSFSLLFNFDDLKCKSPLLNSKIPSFQTVWSDTLDIDRWIDTHVSTWVF